MALIARSSGVSALSRVVQWCRGPLRLTPLASCLKLRHFHDPAFKSYTNQDGLITCTWHVSEDNVPIGSGLEIDFGSIPVDIVTRSCHPEKLKLFVWLTPGAHTGVQGNWLRDLVSFKAHVQDIGTRYWAGISEDAAPPTVKSARVLAVVPPRYFSLVIDTAGGNVSVAGTKEAHMVRLSSGGGRIRTGPMSAMHTIVTSGGGDVEVEKLTGSSVTVDSGVPSGENETPPHGGGTVHIKSVSGLDVKINTAGSSLVLGACMASKADIRSADLQIDELSVADQGLAEVVACPRSVVVLNSISGHVHVTGEGAITLEAQLTDRAQSLQVECPINEDLHSIVSIHAAPTLPISLEAQGPEISAQCKLPIGAVVTEVAPGALSAYVGTSQGASENSPKGRIWPAGGRREACEVKVSGAQKVSVQRRSWAAAMQAAFSARGVGNISAVKGFKSPE